MQKQLMRKKALIKKMMYLKTQKKRYQLTKKGRKYSQIFPQIKCLFLTPIILLITPLQEIDWTTIELIEYYISSKHNNIKIIWVIEYMNKIKYYNGKKLLYFDNSAWFLSLFIERENACIKVNKNEIYRISFKDIKNNMIYILDSDILIRKLVKDPSLIENVTEKSIIQSEVHFSEKIIDQIKAIFTNNVTNEYDNCATIVITSPFIFNVVVEKYLQIINDFNETENVIIFSWEYDDRVEVELHCKKCIYTILIINCDNFLDELLPSFGPNIDDVYEKINTVISDIFNSKNISIKLTYNTNIIIPLASELDYNRGYIFDVLNKYRRMDLYLDCYQDNIGKVDNLLNYFQSQKSL